MTYDISLLGVFQAGTLAEHIIEQDFTGSDKDESGNIIYIDSFFLGNMSHYIEAVLNALEVNDTIDHAALLEMILTPGDGSESEEETSSEDSGTESE